MDEYNFLTTIYNACYLIKCTFVIELSHRIAGEFVNKTNINISQGKVNFHYCFRINTPVHSKVTKKFCP